MPKAKPTEPMIRVNFTLPESMKENWDNFAQKLNVSTSQLVRNAVTEYIKKYEMNESTPQGLEHIDFQLSEIRKEMGELKSQYKDVLSKIKKPEFEELDDSEVQEIRATVMANRQPVQVRILRIYAYAGQSMAAVQALDGKPFLETNAWFHTWNTDQRNVQLVFLRNIILVY